MATSARVTSREIKILVVTCFGHFLSHFNMLVFPAMALPLARYLSMDLTAVVELSFWMYLLFGMSALPWGLAADWCSGKSLMLVFFAGAGISGIGAGFLLDEPVGFSAVLAAVGLFSGVYHPAGLGMISKGVRRLGMAMGYNGMFGNLGLALAPVSAGILNWLWGPRAPFFLLGGLNLAGIILMLHLSVPTKSDPGRATDEKNAGVPIAFMVLLIAMMLGGMVYRGATVIFPSYLELKSADIISALADWLNRPVSGNLFATMVTSAVYTVGILGQYLGGKVAERFEPRYSYLVMHAVTVPAAFLMALVIGTPLILLAGVYFLFLLGMQPVENTLVAHFTPQRFHHSAYGIKFILTFGVGALVVKRVGWVEDTWGLEAIFPALGLLSIALIAAVLLLISRTERISSPGY